LRSRHKIPPTPTNPSPFFNCPKDEDNRIGYSRVQWKKDVGKGDTLMLLIIIIIIIIIIIGLFLYEHF